MSVAIDESVSTMAAYVRQLYISQRRTVEELASGRPSLYVPGPRWDGGGYTSSGRRKNSIWPTIANHVIANNLDPDQLIRAQFVGRTPVTCPLPNQLMSPTAMERYHSLMDSAEDEIKTALDVQKQTLELEIRETYAVTNWTKKEVYLSTLFNESLCMTALFRYCVALSFEPPLDAVIATYRESALNQFYRHKEIYIRLWGELLPKSLRSDTYVRKI